MIICYDLIVFYDTELLAVIRLKNNKHCLNLTFSESKFSVTKNSMKWHYWKPVLYFGSSEFEFYAYNFLELRSPTNECMYVCTITYFAYYHNQPKKSLFCPTVLFATTNTIVCTIHNLVHFFLFLYSILLWNVSNKRLS